MSKSVSNLLDDAKEQSFVLYDDLLKSAEARYNERLNTLQRDYIAECEDIKKAFGFHNSALSISGDNSNVSKES